MGVLVVVMEVQWSREWWALRAKVTHWWLAGDRGTRVI